MDRFRVRWIDSVHTGDDFEQILQFLEVGRDEGPLILVPQQTSHRPRFDAKQNYQAVVFENPDWLGAHLAEHRHDLNHQIWLGISEAVPREKRDLATAALWHFAKLLNDLAGSNKKRKKTMGTAEGVEAAKPFNYQAIEQAPISSFNAVLEQTGEAFVEVAAAHRDLPSSILISRA